MSVQPSNHSLTQKPSLRFVAVTVFGLAALLLGLALVIFAEYHERAYVFLGLGAASFVGGMAGMIVAGSKVKAALSYGLIALGMVGTIVGLNYLTSIYGPPPSQTRGQIAMALSIAAILAGVIGGLMVQPKKGMATFSSVIMLGVIASIGIVALIVGTIFLVVLQYQEAYLLLGVGVVCLIGGIICGIFAQSRARATSR